MKPLNLLVMLFFLAGATWVVTRSEPTVRNIQATYYRAISPFLTVGSKLEVRARSFLDEVEHSKALEAEVETMREDFGRLKLIESQFRKLEAENTSLRRALEFKERVRFSVVAAEVSRRQPSKWWRTVEINRGEKANIATAFTVVTNNGLVGKIDRLDHDRSTVILLTDEACKVAAKVEGSPEVGIVQGHRESSYHRPQLRLRFLSQNARIRQGQRVFSNGRGGVFPPDLLIGEIEQVIPGPQETEALISPAVDFENLETVFVLTPQQDNP